MKFSEKLQKLRKDKGITQEELAQKVFVTRAAVSKWERGLAIPSTDSLKLLCEYFNVDPEDLFDSYDLIDENLKSKKSKNKLIIIFSSIIVALIIFFSILLVVINDKINDVPQEILKYASIIGLEDNYLHVETINAEKEVVVEYILLTDIIQISEKNNKVIEVENLNENDYVELFIVDGKYNIKRIETAMDNALDERSCGFVISFFEQNQVNVLNHLDEELNYIFYYQTQSGMSVNFDYFNYDFARDDEDVLIRKYIINYNNIPSYKQLYVYSLIPTSYEGVYDTKLEQTYNLINDQTVSFTFLDSNYSDDYSVGYRYNYRVRYEFNFNIKPRIEINTIYQYDENLNLISKTEIVNNEGIKILDDAVYVLAEYTKISNNGTTVHKDNYEEVLLYNPFGFDSNKLMWLR